MENSIKSIWDGWEKQALGIRDDLRGGHCAMGWVDVQLLGEGAMEKWQFAESDLPEIVEPIYARVATEIRRRYVIPADIIGDPMTIAYANNMLRLTPEDFRRIDRETQIEAVVRPLLESLPEPVDAQAQEQEK